MDSYSMFGSGVGTSTKKVTSSTPVLSSLSGSNLISALQNVARENSALSQANADKQMAFQADQNRIAREWQERMSNTAYQRAVADLKAAGLNPILATHSGASTPSASGAVGASGNVDNSVVGALASVVVASINSAASQANADKAFLSSVLGSVLSHDASTYSTDNQRASSTVGYLTNLFDSALGIKSSSFFNDDLDSFASRYRNISFSRKSGGGSARRGSGYGRK